MALGKRMKGVAGRRGRPRAEAPKPAPTPTPRPPTPAPARTPRRAPASTARGVPLLRDLVEHLAPSDPGTPLNPSALSTHLDTMQRRRARVTGSTRDRVAMKARRNRESLPSTEEVFEATGGVPLVPMPPRALPAEQVRQGIRPAWAHPLPVASLEDMRDVEIERRAMVEVPPTVVEDIAALRRAADPFAPDDLVLDPPPGGSKFDAPPDVYGLTDEERAEVERLAAPRPDDGVQRALTVLQQSGEGRDRQVNGHPGRGHLRPGKSSLLSAEQVHVRRSRVFNLRLLRYSFAEIAQELGISPGTAYGDVRNLLAEYRALHMETAEELMLLEFATLDDLQKRQMELVQRGIDPTDRDSVRSQQEATLIVLRIAESRRKLLGLDAGAAVAVAPSGARAVGSGSTVDLPPPPAMGAEPDRARKDARMVQLLTRMGAPFGLTVTPVASATPHAPATSAVAAPVSSPAEGADGADGSHPDAGAPVEEPTADVSTADVSPADAPTSALNPSAPE